MIDRKKALTVLLVLAILSAGVASGATPGFTENFDTVTAPALPPGWVATNDQGPDPLWATDSQNGDTLPNSAHVDDPAAVSDKRLDSAPIHILTDQAELRFRHITWFSLGAEASFYDGGVLEISIDGGPFVDVVDAGGTADYTGTVLGAGNPLEGRPAWTFGGPFTFRESVVTLPPAGGHTIVLRWRLGSSGLPSVNGQFGWWIDSIRICDGSACDASPVPSRLDVDPAGNGVWEPGETVDVDPYYYNDSGATLTDLLGFGMTLTGPPGNYERKFLVTGANYGTIPPGALGGCVFLGECFSLQLGFPAPRPVQHWDMQVAEQLSTGLHVGWAIHVGESFDDVAKTNLFYREVETVLHRGVTGGCGGTSYCPGSPALRKQMAVFLLKSLYGESYLPPPATGVFADVSASDPFAPWIENLYSLGITGGCASSPLRYCPDQTVLRRQMAVFLLKTLNGSSYVPPSCQGIFPDVACPSPFADWIEDLYNRQVAAGCGNGEFCPDNPNTRGQMAVFLTRTFGLTLYGP